MEQFSQTPVPVQVTSIIVLGVIGVILILAVLTDVFNKD
jgi:hypothetical protein